MEDFRVGSVPSSEAYGDRHPYGSISRKRPKHHEDAQDGDQEAPADTFEAAGEGEDSAAIPDEQVEDIYLPSEPGAEEE